MDKAEAQRLLDRHLAGYRHMAYDDLVDLIGAGDCVEVEGPSGVPYQIEVDVIWDRRKGGDVRVIASIDDGGLRALVPLTDDFIMTPEGRLLG
jgi:hypothetical protein